MKIAIVVAASAVALMSGCATHSTVAPVAPQAATGPLDDNVDYGRVAAINNAARAQGLLIRWINYPQKKNPAPAGVAPSQADPST